MQAAGKLANKLGMFADEPLERLIQLIARAELPTTLQPYRLNINKLVNLMYSDKKVKMKKLHLILPREIGNVIVRNDVTNAQIKQILKF